jgi:hypothetical protein
MNRRERYEQAARGIARYLAMRQRPDGSFPGPDHYGVAFSLWLWSRLGRGFEPQRERALQRLYESPPPSHGEFNAYALLKCRDLVGRGRIAPLLRGLRFGRRHSANWVLLRSVCRAQTGAPLAVARGKFEARAVLLRYARRGFISDRPGIRSFAYHAFCGALLFDLWAHLRSRWAGRAAAQAAQFLLPFVLPNGDTLYVGRGQQQIFGYGALIYLLEAAACVTGRDEFQAKAEGVLSYLLSYQRPDGSFPLVLREDEPAEPWSPEPRPGWYGYNRYADYLPFLGCCLIEAAQAESVGAPSPGRSGGPGEPVSPVAHPAFSVWKHSRYTAVLALPRGASTNDLAFPYVCVDGVSLFPCYGADGEARPEALPLPYGVLTNGRPYVFRERLRYQLTESGLAGDSPLVRHDRSFTFDPGGFLCRDEIALRRRGAFAQLVSANFLFRNLRALPDGGFETSYRGVKAHLRLVPVGQMHPPTAASATGLLVPLRQQWRAGTPVPAAVSSELHVRWA